MNFPRGFQDNILAAQVGRSLTSQLQNSFYYIPVAQRDQTNGTVKHRYKILYNLMLHQRVCKTLRLPESTHSFTQHATKRVMETCRTQHSDTAITKVKETKTRKGIPKNKQLWRKSGDFLGAELLVGLVFFPRYLK